MTEQKDTNALSNWQWSGLVILRILIGWHLFYEGFIKLLDPAWTSAAYLQQTGWIFSGLFKTIAESPGLLAFADFINIWLLLLTGFALIAGLFSRIASYCGMILLLLYYLAQPPLFETQPLLPGNSIIVNMVLIEAAALFVLALLPSGKFIGIDRLILLLRRNND